MCIRDRVYTNYVSCEFDRFERLTLTVCGLRYASTCVSVVEQESVAYKRFLFLLLELQKTHTHIDSSYFVPHNVDAVLKRV